MDTDQYMMRGSAILHWTSSNFLTSHDIVSTNPSSSFCSCDSSYRAPGVWYCSRRNIRCLWRERTTVKPVLNNHLYKDVTRPSSSFCSCDSSYRAPGVWYCSRRNIRCLWRERTTTVKPAFNDHLYTEDTKPSSSFCSRCVKLLAQEYQVSVWRKLQ